VSLVRDASGKPDYFIRIVEDITERKHADEAIASERALLRTLVDAVPDRIYVKDREGRFLLQNMANARAHGARSPEELLGKTIFDIMPRAAAERIEAEDRAILLSETPVIERERSSVDGAGNPRWVAASKVPLRDATGNVIGIVGVNRDITERKISAQRREVEHAVTVVLAEAPTLEAAMPHLIRTMCDGMGWAYGARWLWNKEENTLVRGEYWSDFVPDFTGVDETPWLKLRFQAPGGLLRRAWFEKEPTWIEDVQREESFNRKETALKFGLHSAYSFPIIAGTEVIGVMEFFGRQPRQPDSMLLQISGSIGRQIGQFVQRKQAESALKESEQQFRQLAENIPQVFWITDVEQHEAIYVSPAWEEITGRPLDQIHRNARSWLDSVHEEDRARVKNARKSATGGGYDESFRIVRPDGSVRWVHDRAFPVQDDTGAVYRIAGIAEDVTERKLAETQLMQLAHYDVLTNLPNRVLFYDRLKQALAQARRNQWNVGVLFIDVDRFKNVNDTLGHAMGDKLLQQVSERLTGAVRAGDTVGRLGGDEFSIVLSNLTSAQDANLVAQKIMAGFNEPFKLDSAEIYVTASIGITLYPDDSVEQDTLIKNADAAMYRAKELGRNSFQFYMPEMNTRAQALLSMESSLRRALDRGEFILHYQPKASAATGEITGVEALLRWQSPERGLISPAEFIPVLEETGLIVPVGDWVIKAACAQVKAWQRSGVEPVPVAVNLSARQFQSPKLGASIVAAVEESGIEPRFLELEITESSLMQNADGAISTLQYLKSCGINVSIDDFGTGYSSLAYLKRFPLDALKIDRSFVRDITSDPDDATITRAVISMAHSLGLKVVAEGVETESQFEFLAENGCDEIQGYYFSRPLTADDCGSWLGEKRRLVRLSQPAESAPTVLLVDDDDDTLALLKRSLAKDGYQLLTARNAHEALGLLGRHRVDLVISDQNMPGVQGVEFLQRVKRLHPRTMRMMTSGDADVRIVTDAINKGEIFRFLPKGMKEEQLRSDVREAMQARQRFAPERSIPPGSLGK
ncbi:MAG TPA: EAL domain-containing protein, partial [Burkholderiales bacterium]|nr:EAL domain-containing protein [Burkholderiales bacterium]